ncbi:nucleotidyltransferase family protein [Rhodoferax sp.]|uniref:nucleotidyltransferase family protein n=1 Tax=Rhodoferax sp. TaxID=50421 RepID=UPI0025D3B252|nr:nucleotidyltransferase family protein [Rhodoferax sp.]MCM2297148.1 nucleotidyltransferase family protein [Rhodoferax sp.]
MSSPATAMLLAAGRGERMRPLTDGCPKPLLKVQGKSLLQWHLEALQCSGTRQVVINTDWLADHIVQAPHPAGLHLRYSHEGHDFGGALETAGGIARALPLLDAVFWVLAADVFTPGFEFSPSALERFAASDKLAHLWLVRNPAHNPAGDFGLQAVATGPAPALNLAKDDPRPRFTFSTIGLYRRALFAPPWCDIAPGNPQGIKAALAPLLRRAMDQGRVSAELYHGPWTDVGTPQRLVELNA